MADAATTMPAANWRRDYVRLRAALVRRRVELGRSQETVAEAVGVSGRTLQRWEAATAEPPAARLFQWAAVLGVRIGFTTDVS